MNTKKISHIALITAFALGVIGVLGKYDLVVIKKVSNYSFELLLAGFALLSLLRIFKK